MGGCKCTYRNCAVKSDGKTHMFHYPVFDKVRCHKWLTNAQRLDFLNLKVSQLKNRVVCQHHFKHDNFMNYKMDKLTHDAVPTENGPFCDESSWPNNEQESAQMFPITAEDIDVDQIDKQASFSYKYADFLINSETDSLNLLVPLKILPSVSSDASGYGNSKNRVVNLPPETKKHQSQPMLVVPPYIKDNNIIALGQERSKSLISFSNAPLRTSQRNNKIKIISEKKILKPLTVKGDLTPVPPTMMISASDSKTNEKNNMNDNENMQVTICNPPDKNVLESQITYKFEPVITESLNYQIMQLDQNCNPCSTIQSITVINPEKFPSCSSSTPIKPLETVDEDRQQITVSDMPETTNQKQKLSPTKVSILKKVPPERVAEIQEKRNFNKKLRDMIEFCLDELDDPEKQINESNKQDNNGLTSEPKPPQKVTRSILRQNKITNQKACAVKKSSKNDSNKKENGSQGVISLLSKEPALPSANEYNIAFLEARLKQMEENLLRKIDQNAQKISGLTQNVAATPTETTKRSRLTQTSDDEESHKKQLFQEISRYLSPECNSLIYEELFLSKYSKETSNISNIASKPERKRKR